MTGPRNVEVAGTGSYVPDRVLTNEDLEKMVDTSDEWITQRTGMKERRLAAPDQTTSDLAAQAAFKVLEDAGETPADVDLIVIATITPDYFFPSTACMTQTKIGAEKSGAFDILSACTGYVAAVNTAWGFISTGLADKVLVIGAECLSRIVDYEDRNTCVLFGDAAGGMLLRAGANGAGGPMLHSELRADGRGGDMMIVPAGGSVRPTTHETVDQRMHYMKIRGREVFKFAVAKFSELVENAMQAVGVSQDEVGLVIPHQVNIRIVDAAAKRLNMPIEKIYTNLDRFGNTSAASIPVAMDEARRNGTLRKGDLVILIAFGGGLTWGSATFRF